MFAHFLNLPEQYSIRNKFKSIKRNFLFLAVVLSLGTIYYKVVYAPQNPTNTITPSINAQKLEKTNNIKKFFELAGITNFSQQTLTKSLNDLKSAYPEVPLNFWERFAAELKSDDLVLKQFLYLYNKYLTNEEIKQLIVSYQTPLGKKRTTITFSPQMSQESYDLGKRYEIAVAQKASKKLEAEGYICSSK